MKTWLMYRNHYGRAMPSPKHQSNFRDNLEQLRTGKYPKRSGSKKPSRLPGFTVENFVKEIGFLFLSLLAICIVAYYHFPGLLTFFIE